MYDFRIARIGPRASLETQKPESVACGGVSKFRVRIAHFLNIRQRIDRLPARRKMMPIGSPRIIYLFSCRNFDPELNVGFSFKGETDRRQMAKPRNRQRSNSNSHPRRASVWVSGFSVFLPGGYSCARKRIW